MEYGDDRGRDYEGIRIASCFFSRKLESQAVNRLGNPQEIAAIMPAKSYCFVSPKPKYTALVNRGGGQLQAFDF